MKQRLKIWVDIGHTPHVAFFVPIIRELENRRHEVIITARDSFQTLSLLDLYGLKYKKIGVHYGKNKFLKIYSHLMRAIRLYFFAFGQGFSVAASHGSPSQMLAAYLLKIPSWVSNDYEPTFCRRTNLYTKVVVPEIIPEDHLKKILKPQKISKYPGLKEDVYVQDFQPDPTLLKELKIDEENIIVTIRPPATYARYHNPESEELMACVMNFVFSKSGVTVIFLPRTHTQKERAIQLAKDHYGRLIVPLRVLHGLNVIWNSDLVVSGGGTMNREAAALGVPVYSIFKGPIGAVDQFLEKTGKLQLIETVDDIKKIKIEKRERVWPTPHRKKSNLVSFLTNQIVSTASARKNRSTVSQEGSLINKTSGKP